MTLRFTLLVAAVLSLLPRFAAADDAANHNAAGAEAYRDGRFVEAAESFNRAWKLSGNAIARKNEAIAWFEANRCPDALLAAASFRGDRRQGSDDLVEVNSVTAICKARMSRTAAADGDLDLATQLLEEAASLKVKPYAREEVSVARVYLARRRGDSGAAVRLESTATPDPANGRRLTGGVLMGAGGVAVVAAVAYHAVILTMTVPELRAVAAEGTNASKYERLARRVRVSRWLVPTLYAVGFTSIGVGTFVFVGAGDARRAQTATAGADDVQLGMTIGGRF